MLGCSMAHMHYLGKQYEDAANDDDEQGPGTPSLTSRLRGAFQKAVSHVKGWAAPVSTPKPSFA